jgi:hypothetical protein
MVGRQLVCWSSFDRREQPAVPGRPTTLAFAFLQPLLWLVSRASTTTYKVTNSIRKARRRQNTLKCVLAMVYLEQTDLDFASKPQTWRNAAIRVIQPISLASTQFAVAIRPQVAKFIGLVYRYCWVVRVVQHTRR